MAHPSGWDIKYTFSLYYWLTRRAPRSSRVGMLLRGLAVPAFDFEDYKAAREREREGWEAEA